MSRARPWLDLLALATLAALVVAFDGGLHRSPRLALVPAALLGVVGGVAVGLALGAVPSSRAVRAACGSPTLLAVVGVLLFAAAAEEAVWRWAVLDGLGAVVGAAAAVSLSTLAFAAAHGRSRRAIGSHTLTGGTFGLAYLATGRLAAAIGAHASYNLAVFADDLRRRA
jgi:membrane protease YdiL (CAAX protease family)